jgi:hypothetical protein
MKRLLKWIFGLLRMLRPATADDVRRTVNDVLGQVSREEASRQDVEAERLRKARRKHGLRANPKNRGGYLVADGQWWLLLACMVAACVGALGQCVEVARALPGGECPVVVEPVRAREWLAERPEVDGRCFWVRLLWSVRPTGKVSLAGVVSEPGIKGGAEF